MRTLRRLSALLLSVLLIMSLAVLPAAAGGEGQQVTVLFTHDLHSHLLPAAGETGGEYGGYARLKTAIDAQRAAHPDAILVDAGDFSMGSLFQTAYATSAVELRVMGALGYDATTFGNHEYDYRAAGLAGMLNAAVASGDPLPAIVEANYLPPEAGQEGYGEDAQAVWDAFARYGVKDYILLERGGVYYAVFGVMGVNSDAYAPMSGMVLRDRAETAQRVVDEATAACREIYGAEPLVICLSHSGTDGQGKGEDYELAKAVSGIDLIVSGHSHTTLDQPIQVGDTYIVSAGKYAENLGVITLEMGADGKVSLADYRLVPIDETLADDRTVSALVEGYKAEVERDYLARFGLGFDQVLIRNPYVFDTVNQVYATQHESTLGNLISDAYKWAAEQADGQRVDMALTASGVIRETFPQGEVTVSDVFNTASLGIGADGVPGYPLVAVYLTGADLKAAMEVDASVQPLMSAAQLFCSGAEYSFNTRRMIFNKVDHAALRRDDGSVEPIADDQLYRVVTGLYCGQMLGTVEGKSFGLLTITARDADGAPIDMDRLEDYIIHNADGSEVKEWYAIASYLRTMGGEIDPRYSQPDGRKTVYASLNPVDLLRSPNKFTFIALAVLLILLAVVILIIRAVVRRVRRGGGGRSASGYRPYRGKR